MATVPPQPAGASSSDVAAAISNASTPATGLAGGLTPVGMDWGVIVSIQSFSVTLTLAGSSTSIAGVAYMANYTPTAGDTVIVWHVGSDLVVAGGLTGTTSSPIPVGAMLPFPQAFTNPAWLLCNGASFSTVTYPALFAFLGVSTVPNMQGVVPMGAGANGIVLATRDPNGGSEAHVHGSGGGHVHTGPSHTHTTPNHSHSHNHAGLTHSHSHSHQPATNSTNFIGTGGAIASGTGSAVWSSQANTNTDATTASPTTDTDATTAAPTTAASGTANTGNTDPGNTASYGSGTANVPPQLGVDYYIRAR